MQDDERPDGETLDGAIDESDLGGTGEYTATGGYLQPLHDPRPEGPDDEGIPFAYGDSLAELYRYSLGRATQDEPRAARERWVDGPLHLEDPRALWS